MTPEQQARNLLERMGFEDAQGLTAGDLVELANLLSKKVERQPSLRMEITASIGATFTANKELLLRPGDVFDCYLREEER